MAEFFKVGDHVRVRQWEDMATEFPIGQNGSIEVAYFFTVDMCAFCGTECFIQDARPGKWDGREMQDIICKNLPAYMWSNEMFELVQSAPQITITSLDELL